MIVTTENSAQVATHIAERLITSKLRIHKHGRAGRATTTDLHVEIKWCFDAIHDAMRRNPASRLLREPAAEQIARALRSKFYLYVDAGLPARKRDVLAVVEAAWKGHTL
jgi:hypothetical protein